MEKKVDKLNKGSIAAEQEAADNHLIMSPAKKPLPEIDDADLEAETEPQEVVENESELTRAAEMPLPETDDADLEEEPEPQDVIENESELNRAAKTPLPESDDSDLQEAPEPQEDNEDDANTEATSPEDGSPAAPWRVRVKP